MSVGVLNSLEVIEVEKASLRYTGVTLPSPSNNKVYIGEIKEGYCLCTYEDDLNVYYNKCTKSIRGKGARKYRDILLKIVSNYMRENSDSIPENEVQAINRAIIEQRDLLYSNIISYDSFKNTIIFLCNQRNIKLMVRDIKQGTNTYKELKGYYHTTKGMQNIFKCTINAIFIG